MHATIDFFQSQIGALRLSRCTKLNRFAGSVVLTHKHLLLETIRRAGAPSHATQTDVFAASRAYQRQSSLDAGYAQAILPTSFVLPAERAELAAAHAATLDSGEVERRRWIIKPLKTGRGKGITFSDDVSAIDASLDSVSKVRSPTGPTAWVPRRGHSAGRLHPLPLLPAMRLRWQVSATRDAAACVVSAYILSPLLVNERKA